MADTPVFTGTPRCGVGTVSTANPNRDGTGTVATVFTPGANGSLLARVIVKAIVTTTAGTVRLFVHDGSAFFLLEEIAIPANTASASNPAVQVESSVITPTKPLYLPNGYTLRAATEAGQEFKIITVGGDF